MCVCVRRGAPFSEASELLFDLFGACVLSVQKGALELRAAGRRK